MDWSPDVVREHVDSLPPLNPELQRLLQLLDSADADLGAIERQIITDPVLTARILQLANSSFYGFRGEIASVGRACSVLGFHTLKSLVYSMVVLSRFQESGAGSPIVHPALWRHSLLTAAITKNLCEGTELDPLTGFTVGLFHNFGLVLMDCLFQSDLRRCLENALRQKLSLRDSMTALGIPAHEKLAALLLQRWHFPVAIIEGLCAPEQDEDNTQVPDSSARLRDTVRVAALLATAISPSFTQGVPLGMTDWTQMHSIGKDIGQIGPVIMASMGLYEELVGSLLE